MAKVIKSGVLGKKIEEVEMNLLLKNGLIKNGITEVNQIAGLRKHDVYMFFNFGKRRQELLNEFMKENNIQFRLF